MIVFQTNFSLDSINIINLKQYYLELKYFVSLLPLRETMEDAFQAMIDAKII